MKNITSGTVNWLTNALVSSALAVGLSVSGGASAALLGVEPGLPLINYNNVGVVNYNDVGDTFSVTNTTTLSILFPGPVPRTVSDSTTGDGRTVGINIEVDGAGNLVGGVPGDDLIVTGAVDTTGDGMLDADGVLLTGEIVAFGSQDSGGPTDFYDFRFTVTGGALAPFFAGQDAGVTLTSEGSTFTGNFNVSFGGAAKGNVGPVPAVPRPASLGDRVWEDRDADGDQDCINIGGLDSSNKIPGDGGSTCSEPPVPDVPVALTDCQGNVLDTTSTDADGFYLFTNLDPNTDYCVQFTKPDRCEWTVQDAGNTDLTDSDVDGSGFAGTANLDPGETDRSWDAGLVCEGPDIDIEKATNGVDADDPNAGDAPQVVPGGMVTWTYIVTNTGPEPLENFVVTDDQGVALSCPGQPATLFPGQDFTCTASGLAEDLNTTGFTTVPGTCGSIPNTPLYENMGHVSATGVNSGDFVEDVDPSHYCNPQEPAIDIEKATNGVDADDPNAGDAPQVAVGGLVSWTYVITNIGNEPLNNVDVVDDQGVVLSCPGQPAVLDPGASFQCTASGFAEDLNSTGFTTVPGTCGSIPNTPMYENKGTVTGIGVNSGAFVEDVDPSHYCNPQEPSIDIEKATNGVDADDPNAGDAPQVMPGELVSWTYVVTNTGNEPLDNVDVVDDQGVAVACPQTTLAPGESMICTASGLADDLNSSTFTTVPGLCGGFPQTPLYENMGKASGNGVNSGQFVEDDDPSHYCNPPEPAIDIEKATNGVDADDPNAGDAPQVMPGDLVTWSYVVTNTGNTVLNNVMVNDDQIGPVTCPMITLAPMQSMLCSASGTAEDLNDTTFTTVPGLCGGFPQTPLYENKGKATGQSPAGDFVEDEDPSHYCNPPAPGIEVEKLTNGFDADSRDESSTSFPAPMGNTTVPGIGVGSLVTWTYKVTNTGNTVLNPVNVSDDAGTPGMTGDDFCTPNAGPCAITINCPLPALNPGQTMDCSAQMPAHDLTLFTPVVAGTCGGMPAKLYENGAVATGTPPTGPDVMDDDPSHYCNPPGMCNLEVDKTCLVIPPPTPDVGVGSCQKPIDVLKLEYAGSKTITGVTWYSGDVNPGDVIRSATATELATLNAGGMVEFNGFAADSPNDVQILTSFSDGSSTTSEFHRSCSDRDMDGPEDCGKVIGDGKDNSGLPSSSNIWTFRGTARTDGVGISCPLPPVGPGFPTQTACEFTPPQSAASCSDIKDITALTMIWQGANNVDILTEGGESITGINNGDVVTFGTVGLGKDVELTLSGGVSGTSKFHVSCSDDDMDGPEDCGTSQGNGKDDDGGFVNDWALEGMTGEKGVIDCAVVQGRSGAQVSYGIAVNNLNDEAVTVNISDPLLGLDIMNQAIAANSTFELVTDPQLIVPDGSNDFVNVVTVSGQTGSGASCNASATATVTRNPPPPAPVSCGDIKPITALSMIWDGPSGVTITSESGEVFSDVLKGNQITFGGTPNDFEVSITGAVTGNSKFHVSCSDRAMDGSDDCGTNQGDGKGNDSNLNNQFLLDGMIGEDGSFACNLNNTGVVAPSAGGGSTGGGNVTGASSLDLGDDKKAKWELTNNGSQDVFVTRVVVTWPSQHQKLKKLKLAGDFAKDVNDTTSATDVPNEKAFENDANKRKLKKGQTKKLEIEFDKKYKNHTQGDYTITVEFDNGDTLSI